MNRRWWVIVLLVVTAACSGGEGDTVSTSVALTVAAAPTQTPVPTSTPQPTETSVPSTETPSPTPVLACSDEASEFTVAMDELLDSWDDANELASRTARIALAGPVSDLQDIKQQASALDAPECAADVKETILAYMDHQIEVYFSFMEDDPIEFLSAIAQAFRAAVDISFPALRDGTEFDETLATMLVLGTPLGASVEINETGAYQEFPWLETQPINNNIVSLQAFTTVSDDHTLICYLFLNGIFVDSTIDDGPRVSITCEGEVES